MKIAILGATSQIARDLILSFQDQHELYLYSRKPVSVTRWILQSNLQNYKNYDFVDFDNRIEFDAILNFVGAGNPETIQRMGKRIVAVTESFDEMVLDYLPEHPNCLYVFMSSGAVFGDNFSTPVTQDTRSIFPINHLLPQHYYGLAKAQAEYRHRLSSYNIVDLRIFNYFSSSADIQSQFMICGMLRAILEDKEYTVDKTPITRDYVGPKDFHQMIEVLLKQDKINMAVDMYSRSPISKDLLLQFMKEKYGLKVRVQSAPLSHATGVKENYYSTNLAGYSLGYEPALTSIETIFEESDKLLKCK